MVAVMRSYLNSEKFVMNKTVENMMEEFEKINSKSDINSNETLNAENKL